MRNKNYRAYSNSQSGFTLVELLIVIVIIGILAGVVIGVLNPVQQQNRARDGATRAQLDKMALSTKSLYVSSPRSIDRSPTESEFAGGIASSADVAGNCNGTVTAGPDSCTFQITGQPLATNCGATNFTGTGTNQCSYVYWRTNNEFRIGGHGAASPARMFVYHYLEASTGTVTEGFWSCPDTFNPTTTAPSAAVPCDRIN